MPAVNGSGHFYLGFRRVFSVIFCTFADKLLTNSKADMNKQIAIVALTALIGVAGCKEKKQTQDIIAPKMETPKPQAPIRMQAYSDSRNVQWLGKTYTVEWSRTASDSLPLVKDEAGQKFVDNLAAVTVRRADGTVAISKTFTKAAFDAYLTPGFRKSGLLAGLVFIEADDQHLEFAVSVGLPQSDEYIPLELKIDNFGNVKIERDSDLDTSGSGEHDADNDEED